MTDTPLFLLARTILKDRLPEFTELATHLQQEGSQRFVGKHRELLEWSDQQFPVEQLNRGEFLPRLFRALNADLEAEGLALGLIDIKDDQYYFLVLPVDELATINGLAADSFSVTSPCLPVQKFHQLYIAGLWQF